MKVILAAAINLRHRFREFRSSVVCFKSLVSTHSGYLAYSAVCWLNMNVDFEGYGRKFRSALSSVVKCI